MSVKYQTALVTSKLFPKTPPSPTHGLGTGGEERQKRAILCIQKKKQKRLLVCSSKKSSLFGRQKLSHQEVTDWIELPIAVIKETQRTAAHTVHNHLHLIIPLRRDPALTKPCPSNQLVQQYSPSAQSLFL